MGEGKLYPLGSIKPFDLSDRKELEAFLLDYFPRTIPGFALLEADAEWGECSVDLFGKDGTGSPMAIFPTVFREERVFLEAVARALHAAWWFEENKGMLKRVYEKHDLQWSTPLRVIVVVPALSGRSRAIGRWLIRSGVEVMEYRCYEFESYDERRIVLRGISFEAKGENVDSLVPGVSTAPEAPREPSHPQPSTEVMSPPPHPSAFKGDGIGEGGSVEAFIASLTDENLKAISARLFSFLLSLFPGAVGVVNPAGHSFTLTIEGEHVVSIYPDQGFLWLEAGPERIPTGRITDLGVLEKVMKRLELLLGNRLRKVKIRTR